MSLLPERFDWKAIRVPSGDQSAAASLPVWVVTWTAVPPAAGITQMSLLSLRFDWNATSDPSGDQVG